jgi:hypothetical protein
MDLAVERGVTLNTFRDNILVKQSDKRAQFEQTKKYDDHVMLIWKSEESNGK